MDTVASIKREASLYAKNCTDNMHKYCGSLKQVPKYQLN